MAVRPCHRVSPRIPPSDDLTSVHGALADPAEDARHEEHRSRASAEDLPPTCRLARGRPRGVASASDATGLRDEPARPLASRSAHCGRLPAGVAATRPDGRHRADSNARPGGDGVRRGWPGCRRSRDCTRRSCPLLAYALFGPSNILVVGPDSAIAPMIAAAMVPLAAPASRRAGAAGCDARPYRRRVLRGRRVVRLGFLTDLLSQPVRHGYMNRIALTIIVNQLPTLLRALGGGARRVPPRDPRFVEDVDDTARGARHRRLVPGTDPSCCAG